MQKTKFIHSLLLLPFLAMVAISCSSGEPQTLEGKKAVLEAKKKELIALNKEIDQLQTEIESLDPEMANQVRRIPVNTLDLTHSKFQHFVKVQGQVEANKNIMVSAMQPGRITAIYVREGQSVGKGALLAQLDDAVMKSSISEVESSLELAEIMYNKQAKLWEQEIGTEVQYLTAKNQKESLERRLATLKEQLKLSKVYAPISGVVDEIMPKVGEMLNPGYPAFRIVNASDLSLKANLSEVHLPYIKRGDKVKVSFPTINMETEAKVTAVGQSIDPNNRTFKVEVKLPNNRLFKANMFGEISVNDQTVDEAIVIPLELIQQTDIGQFVYIVEKNEKGAWLSKRKNIQLGLSAEGEVLVKEGLAVGDKLVTIGYKDLSDGQEVVFEESLANN
ncbi:MAG: efflux RND transporter periplasmic adaptor subunit [Bacteroidota bacterium]